jgi:hypothetical protein
LFCCSFLGVAIGAPHKSAHRQPRQQPHPPVSHAP